MGCHFLLQRIFPAQELNPGLLHCRQILYQQSYEGTPNNSVNRHNYYNNFIDEKLEAKKILKHFLTVFLVCYLQLSLVSLTQMSPKCLYSFVGWNESHSFPEVFLLLCPTCKEINFCCQSRH